MLKENFILQANNIHHNKYSYSLLEYKNNYTNITIICPVHNSFEQTPKNHLNGHGCPKCATEFKSTIFRKSLSDLIDQFNKKHNYKYNYDKVIYKNNRTKIIVTCPNHGDFNILPYHHSNGIGCSKCSNNFSYTTNDFIITSKIIHGDTYDYSLSEYKNNHTKVAIICKKHGVFYQKPSHHLMGCNCPKCNSSKGEEKIRKFLEKNNIFFIEQKRFKECKNIMPLPFDFYLPDYNICIEYDGLQHSLPIRGVEQLKKIIKHDNKKNYFCKKNSIKLIRISYKKFIKIENILTKKIK